MAPLCVAEHSCLDVFSNERFSRRLSLQLDSLLVVEPPSSSSTASTSTRRVRFSQEQDKIFNPEREFYTDEDIRTKWIDADGLRDIRMEAKKISSSLRHRQPPGRCPIALAHRKTTLIIRSDFESLIKLSPSTPEEDISSWCSQEDGRRGLERFSSTIYYCFRRQDMGNVRSAVLTEQHRQQTQHFSDPEAIAQKSREQSRRSRNFALFIGGADAKQVLKRESSTPPCRQAPPRKRSKIYHQEEIKSMTT